MENQPQNFFLYVRKSTDESDRQIKSIPAQLAELAEFAAKEGLTIIKTFEESRTAKSPGRPQFNLMLKEIEKGKAQGILAWHPDRLARNSVDGGRIVYLVDTGKILDLRFPTFRFEASAHGKFMLNIAFCQSKYYIDNLSENIKRGYRQKLRDGIWPGRAPVGYINDKATKGIVPDPGKAPLVRKAFQLYASGDYAIYEVRKRVNGLGLLSTTGKVMSVSNYQKTFKNPLYYGAMRFKGELHEAKHDPIITKKLFDEAQAVMERKSKPKTPELKPYRYRGVFRCGECGCFITTETQKGHNYLRCTKRVSPCSQKCVREERIPDEINRAIQMVVLKSEVADWLVGELEQERSTEAATNAAAIARITALVAECDRKLDLLLDMRLDGQINEPEYLSKKHVLINEKAELKGKLVAFEHNRRNRLEPAIAFINEAKQATFFLTDGNPDKSRDFLRNVGSNLTLAEKRLSVDFKTPWKLVADFNSTHLETAAAGGEISQKSNWRSFLLKVKTFFAENPDL